MEDPSALRPVVAARSPRRLLFEPCGDARHSSHVRLPGAFRSTEVMIHAVNEGLRDVGD
jgi:hypothetical protein